MSIQVFCYRLCGCAAAALLAGCSALPFASAQGGLAPDSKPAAKHVRPASCPPCLYVANQNPARVLVFPVGATGDTAPLQDISGSRTDLENPTAVAIDEKSNIYVSDFSANAILEFAAGSTGNVKPKATIAGELTRLAQPAGNALDENDNIYVSNSGGKGSVEVFAAGSKGNVCLLYTSRCV